MYVNHEDNELNPMEHETGMRVFSRRTFLSATAVAGALAFLGSVGGGSILAYADEEDNVHFVIYILSRYEVPVMSYNVASGKSVVLPHVKFRITSQYRPEATPIEMETDEKGFAPIDVRPLSYQKDDPYAKRYSFWGSLEASCDKYREFATDECWIESGTAPDEQGNRTNVLQIPLQPLDDNPYLRKFQLDKENIQYVNNYNAPVWSGNDRDHDIVAEIVTPTKGVKVSATLKINNAAKGTAEGTASPDRCTLKFTDKWLKILQPGDKLSIDFMQAGGKVITYECTMGFEAAKVIGDGTQATAKDIMLSPGITSEQAAKGPGEEGSMYCPIPGFLNRQGDSFNLSVPGVPIQIFFDTGGSLGATGTLLNIDFAKKHYRSSEAEKEPEEEDPMDSIKSFKGLSGKKAWEGYADGVKKDWKDFKDCYKDIASSKEPTLGASRITADFTAKLCIDVIGLFSFKNYKALAEGEENGKAKTHWTGDIGIRPKFSANAAANIQVVACGIPFIVTFDASFFLQYSLLVGGEFDDFFKNFQSHFHLRDGSGGHSIAFVLRFDFGATLAIGVKGIASAGVRCYCYLQSEFDFTAGKDVTGKELPFPHMVFKLGADCDAVLQLLFMKKTVNITHSDPWVLKDNWKNKQPAALELDPLLSNATLYGNEYLLVDNGDFDVVVDDDLWSVVETSGWWEESEEAAYAPSYGSIVSRCSGTSFSNPGVLDILNDHNDERSAINGVVPDKQEILYQDVFSDPRIRIVHTDGHSFANDRAFMVRVAIVEVGVPASTSMFLSAASNETPEDLVVVNSHGNMFIKEKSSLQPSDTVSNNTTVPRARITISEWNPTLCTWGEARIVDFSIPGEVSQTQRLNSQDIDFAVDYYDGNIYLAITSLVRPDLKDPSFIDHESNQYISMVRWGIGEKGTGKGAGVVCAGSTRTQLGLGGQQGGMSLFHPHILMQKFDDKAGRSSEKEPLSKEYAVVYSYACRYDGQDRTDATLVATIFDMLGNDPKSAPSKSTNCRYSLPTEISVKGLRPPAVETEELVTGWFEVSCPDRNSARWDSATQSWQSTVTIAWSHTRMEIEGVTYPCQSLVFAQTFSITEDGEGAAKTYASHVNQHSSLELPNIPNMAKLGVTKQRGVFGYSDVTKPTDKKAMTMVALDPNTLQLSKVENVGNSDKTDYFASFNGRRLYCVRTMHGKAPKFADDIVETAQAADSAVFVSDGPFNAPLTPSVQVNDNGTEPNVKLYQLCEARWVEGIGGYHDFYPLAQIDFIPDNIGVVAASKKHTHFTFTSIHDIADKESKSTVYQVAVPAVVCAKALGASPQSPFAAPGDTCYYTLDVANVGNTPITELTVKVTNSATGEKIAETTYSDLAPYYRPSPDDAKPQFKQDENGALVANENGFIDCDEPSADVMTLNGILWPGHRRTYRFGFTVPAGLSKKVDFQFEITGSADHMDEKNFTEGVTPMALDDSGLPLLADEDYLDSNSDGVPLVLIDQTVLASASGYNDQVAPADYDFTSANYAVNGKGGDNPGGGGGNGGNGGSGAKTGDNMAGAPVLAAAALAAGAMLAKGIREGMKEEAAED